MQQVLQNFDKHLFKVSVTVLLAIVGWFSSQVYLSLQEIQKQFQEMDKRVSMIEVSRSIYLERYIKLEGANTEQQRIVDSLQSRTAVLEDVLKRHHIY